MNKTEYKAAQKARHLENLKALLKLSSIEDAENVYKRLRRAECKLNRLFCLACERNLEGTEEQQIQVLKKRVRDLTGNLSGLYFNHDPRGYAIKINELATQILRDRKGINIQTDMGGYGLLAPEF